MVFLMTNYLQKSTFSNDWHRIIAFESHIIDVFVFSSSFGERFLLHSISFFLRPSLL